MNKLREVREEKKLDNKGFSLVELIIVIAIMAVLIGVLAPQYLKYVQKSRESADLDSINTMIHAIEIYNADPETTTPAIGNITGGAPVVVDPTIQTALTVSGMGTLPQMKSTEYGNTWVIQFTTSGWSVTTESTNSKLAAALGR